MFRKLLTYARSRLAPELAHHRFVLLLGADDATLRELGVTRADVRLAFLLNPGEDNATRAWPSSHLSH